MIGDLETRWRDERTPQAGLRLAEAYRDAGQGERALEILDEVEEKLAAEPANLAARVALGGLRFSLGQIGGAARALEAVVARDATHLKANKLLVEVYLELDQRQRARDRLDLYRLLNEGDPDIEQLEDLVVGFEAESAEPPASAVVPGAAVRRSLRVPAADPFADLAAIDVAAPAPADAVFALPWPAVTAAAVGAPAVPGTTATLGELYREQGHRQEAEEIFREVLEREPENLVAREGLAGVVGPDARSRRIEVLRNYLERIRRARGETTH